MNNLNDIQAELTSFMETLDIMDKDYKDGTLSEVFYFKRRISLVRDKERTLKKLKDILNQNDAQELSLVLDKVTAGAQDEDVEKQLEKAQQEGKDKSWGVVLKEAISEKKGSIVQVALSAAMKVARFLLLV